MSGHICKRIEPRRREIASVCGCAENSRTIHGWSALKVRFSA